MLKSCINIVTALLLLFLTASIFAVDSSSAMTTELLGSNSGFLACKSKIGEIPTIAFDELNSTNIAKVLGWVRDKKAKDLCGGYYLEPQSITSNPQPQPYKDAPITVSASQPSFFSQFGASVLQGNVTINQPGREVTADKITISRDKNTGKFSNTLLTGHVHLREYGKVIVAQTGYLDFVKHYYSLSNAVYRSLSPSATGFVNAWGRAEKVVSDAPGILKLHKASYSTCPPDNPTWQVKSRDLILDKNTGRGTAENSYLLVKNIPVFYSPYFSFPIDKRRKSGFLFPSFSQSRDSGYSVTIPYYFNLAPNYDLTLAPQPFTRRGIMMNGEVRTLTERHTNILDFSYIPKDRVFTNFRDEAPSLYKPSHALEQLENASSWRGLIGFKDSAKYNSNWSSSLEINRVSDDYFLQDFGSIPAAIDNDQLLNQADLNYASEHWHFLGRLQDFQTLHPLVQYPTQDQYKRLPQLDLIGDYPSSFGGLNYQVSSEFVNFEHRNDFYSGVPVVTGRRMHLLPSISLPWRDAGGYLVPQMQLDVTNYALRHQTANIGDSLTRVVPLLSLDSGLVFNREFNVFHNAYMQTLEPRVFYLFVPKVNQNNIQVFDTTLPAIDFNQLFRTNRFSSYDRIGDANQFTLALTSRLLNDFGQEKLNLGLGQIFLLHTHQVCIDGSCINDPLAKEQVSPLVGQLQYFMTNQWSSAANIAWDPNYHQFDTANLSLQYNKDAKSIASIWYNFTRNGDVAIVPTTEGTVSTVNTPPRNLNRFGASLSWPLLENWHILGSVDYNISYAHAQNYFYGIEYENCCWAIRLVQSKVFASVNPSGNNTYNSAFYLQLLLKGLGNVGTSNAGGLLTSQIPGYQDKFATGYKL